MAKKTDHPSRIETPPMERCPGCSVPFTGSPTLRFFLVFGGNGKKTSFGFPLCFDCVDRFVHRELDDPFPAVKSWLEMNELLNRHEASP